MNENKANHHKTRTEWLTIVYFLYQALIFFFVSGGAGANHRWVPPAFSFSLSVVYFSCLFDAVVRFHRIQHELDLTRMELVRILTVEQICADTKTDQISFFIDVPKTPEEVRYREIKRRVVLGVVVALLIVFAVVMLLGCWLVSAAAVESRSVIGTQ